MSYLNSVQLIGNLGEKPQVLKKETKGSFVRLSLATNRKYMNAKGESIQDTQWHTVFLNNGIGKYAASHLEKGDKVLILGELRHKQWKDKEGKTHYSTAVYAKECRTLFSKSQENKAVESQETNSDQETNEI